LDGKGLNLLDAQDLKEIVNNMRKVLVEGTALLLASLVFISLLSELGLRGFYYFTEGNAGSLEEQLKRSQNLPAENIGTTDSLRGLIKPSSFSDIVYELRPNLSGVFLKKAIATNSFGMRDREYPFTKAENTFRVVGLGDSVMFGWGVEEHESYLARIEESLNQGSAQSKKVEILNFAVPGYNTAMEVATFENRALLFKPDLVIMHFVNNDWGVPYFMEQPRDLFSLSRSYLWELVAERARLLLKGTTGAKGLVNADKNSLSREVKQEVAAQYRPMLGRGGFEKALHRLAALSKPAGIPVIVVVGSGSAEQKDALQKVGVEQLGFKLVRVGPHVEEYFKNLGRPITKRERRQLLTVSPQDSHPNALGHELYRRALLPVVQEALVSASIKP